MNWTQAIFEVIDMRSFSNLWYWIGIAVLWSTMSHWVLGVPFDLITKAKRSGGEAEQDVIELVRISVKRLLRIVDVTGQWLALIVCFTLTTMILLAFFYDIEFAQALTFIVVPLTIVGMLSVRTSRKIEDEVANVEVLYKVLLRHRVWTQVIGMVSIFLTALYGMYHNLTVVPF